MDKINLFSEKKNSIGNLAVDGLIYGLISGGVMFICLATFSLLSGEKLEALLVRFSAGQLTTPVHGLLSHFAISATYGVLFGVIIQPLLFRFPATKFAGWLAGAAYGAFLLILAELVILPGTASRISELPFWQSALAHEIYGLALGGLFTIHDDS